MIFLGTVGSIAGAYGYDRRECRLIKEQYVEKVKHLAEVPLESLDLPRKVTVYASKWPGDDEYDRSMKYFKKYVKVSFSGFLTSSLLPMLMKSEADSGSCCCGFRAQEWESAWRNYATHR